MNQQAMNLTPQSTIGEIVADNYETAGIFRKYGLDFCCGGGTSLEAACRERSIRLEELLADLQGVSRETPSAGENYRAWEPDHLVDHIVETHHRFVREKSEEIANYAEKVARVHGRRHPENIEIHSLFIRLANGLLHHLEEEEERLFPLIRQVYADRMKGQPVDDKRIASLEKELERMVDDHEEAGALMAAIRERSGEFTPPADACATYRILYQNLEGFEEDLHRHVHLENNILFQKAEKLIR